MKCYELIKAISLYGPDTAVSEGIFRNSSFRRYLFRYNGGPFYTLTPSENNSCKHFCLYIVVNYLLY